MSTEPNCSADDNDVIAKQIMRIVSAYRADKVMGVLYREPLLKALQEGKVYYEKNDVGEVIGFALFEVQWRKLPLYFLNKIAVRKDFIGKGVGYKLLKKVIDAAAQEDKGVVLRVAESNEHAVNFYSRAGFEQWDDRFGKASRAVNLVLCVKFLNKQQKALFQQEWNARSELPSVEMIKAMTLDEASHDAITAVLADVDEPKDASKVIRIDLHENKDAKSTTQDVLMRNAKRTNITAAKSNKNRYGSDYIVEWKGNPLTVNYISSIPVVDREEIAEFLFDYFRSGGFPYPQYDDEELLKEYDSLKSVDTNKFLTGKILSSGCTIGAKNFRHFNPHFWDTKDIKGRSVVQVFNDDKMLMSVIRNRLGITFFYRGISYPFDISGNMIRQGIRSMRLAPQITNFRPAVMKFMCDKYLHMPKTAGIVLDYSVGFNQRLLGAAASSKVNKYIGIDPWTDTIEAGKKIVDFYSMKDRVDLINSGSENADLTPYKDSVDLAFSSPPYYTKEIYSDDKNQAYSNRTYKEFIEQYWVPTVKNVDTAIKSGGYFAINICRGSVKEPMHIDMVNAIKALGYEFVNEFEMTYQKSHLSDKVSAKGTTKSDPITILKKK